MSKANTDLGKIRVAKTGMSAPETARIVRGLGCESMTPRRMYRIESGLARPTEQEKRALALLYAVHTWEIGR